MNAAQVTPPDPGRRPVRVAGVLGLVLLAAVLGVLLAKTRHDAAPLPPPPAPFLPEPSAVATPPAGTVPPPPAAAAPSPPVATTTRTPGATVPASVDRPDATSGAASAPRGRPPSPRPPRSPLTGTYRVVDSFDDGFIGEVLIANPTGRERDWTVRLRFGANVGDLRTSWVESAPQASLRVEGGEFVWRSGAPVPGGGRVALRFHFARSGAGDRPLSCSVDGAACAG